MKEEIHKIFYSDSNTGRIIKDFAQLEWLLDLVLTRYFTAQERFYEFGELFIARLSIVQKIDILRKMKFHKQMISKKNLVLSLEKLRKFRNILAHSSSLTDNQLKNILSDNELLILLKNFPDNYQKEIKANKNRLNCLLHSYISRGKKKKK